MADKPKTEVIVVHETVAKSLARDAGTFATVVGIIGVGVWCGSSAMQWVGAIMLFVAACFYPFTKSKRLTIAEARRRLDEIEQNSSTP